MLTVLNVLHEERVGGPQLRVLQVAQKLRSSDVETVVVIPRGDPAFASLLRQAQIPFHELDLVRLRDTRNPVIHAGYLARFWPNVEALRRLIRQHRIEIVHTNGLMHLQAAIAARLEGVRLVWHLNDVSTPLLLRRMLLPVVQSWSDRIAVTSGAVVRCYFGDAAERLDRVRILRPPVATTAFRPEAKGSIVRAELGIDGAAPVVGVVTNLCPGKGVQFLLEAAPTIKQHFPGTKFLVVGAALANRRAYSDYLARRTVELGLQMHVFFMGFRQDIPPVMRAMTVYVHPSESESGPMSAIEASASGLPVVATDVGGTSEVVEHGVTGLLVPPRSPDRIAEAVVRLLESPDTARAMGMAGAERMRRLFSLEACVDAHLRLYNEAVGIRGWGLGAKAQGFGVSDWGLEAGEVYATTDHYIAKGAEGGL